MLAYLCPRPMRALSLIAALALVACKEEAPAPPYLPSRAEAGAPTLPAPAPDPDFAPPPSPELLPTTAGNIAFSNLAGDVQTANRLLAQSPRSVDLTLQAVAVFLAYAKITGEIDYYDRALALAESAVKIEPKLATAWSSLSSVHAALHRFDEALADLKQAEKLGERGTDHDSARAAILQATGRFSEARPIVAKVAAELPRINTVGALAALDADESHLEDAERHFAEAQKLFRDVSPLPLVWLWFQRGLMWQLGGRPARARELFAAAHERLPQHVAVTSHLAGMLAAMGDRTRAIALLWPVTRSAQDPEYLGQLSQLLREEGNLPEAERLKAQAMARYEALLSRHPAAFADHAARFWLGPGGSPQKALPLAKQNLDRRKTPDAYALLLEVRLATKDSAAETCQIAQAALAPPAHPPARLRILASRAFTACGQQDRADAELRAVSKTPATPTSAPATAPTAADSVVPAPSK